VYPASDLNPLGAGVVAKRRNVSEKLCKRASTLSHGSSAFLLDDARKLPHVLITGEGKDRRRNRLSRRLCQQRKRYTERVSLLTLCPNTDAERNGSAGSHAGARVRLRVDEDRSYAARSGVMTRMLSIRSTPVVLDY